MSENLQFHLSEEHLAQIGEEAEELGLSRSKYARQRLEAGRLVFQSSDRLDVDTLSNLIDGNRTAPVDSELQTSDNDIKEQILTNLPTDEERALTKEDLRKTIFGSEDEQFEAIDAALRQLNDAGKVRPAFDGGYIRNE